VTPGAAVLTADISSHPWGGAVAIGVDEARCWILDQIGPCAAVTVPLAECLGLVLADGAVAPDASPRFDTSAMDGYALHHQPNATSTWRVVGQSLAGRSFDGTVGPGEAVRIMTGARVPPGAGAVVPLEAAVERDGVVRSGISVTPGANIRPRGSDHDAGDIVVGTGTRLNSAHVAVLASMGHARPSVVRRPRIGVMSTGDEVAGTGSSSIRDANRPGLLALVQADGALPVDLGVATDNPDDLRRRVERAVDECDAVITTGGVSVGDHDHVKRILTDLASPTGTARWMRVAVRPAKPLMFATISGVPVFGLPGNPASAFVSYHLFARPALDRLAGDRLGAARRSFTAVAATDLRRRPDGRLHVVPVVAEIVSGRLRIRPVRGSGGHDLAATAAANAYAYLPDGPAVPAGTLVDCGWTAAVI
jgi:molybdenum cofactor synthesis domain-containing protein